jgi:hypothetical protein
MKTLTFGLLALLLALFVIDGCTKGALTGKNGQLVATQYTVSTYQSDSLILVGAKTTDSIKWNVVPAGFSTLMTSGNKGLIQFKKAGTFTVSAADNGNTPALVTITVLDSIAHPATQYQTVSLSNVPVTLSPKYYQSKAADSSYLFFSAQIGQSYCPNSTLNVTTSRDANNNFGINFINMQQPVNCVSNSGGPYFTSLFFSEIPQSPKLLNGTYLLKITVSGTVYSGSVVVTSTAISFNWPYTSGVVITPAQISR